MKGATTAFYTTKVQLKYDAGLATGVSNTHFLYHQGSIEVVPAKGNRPF